MGVGQQNFSQTKSDEAKASPKTEELKTAKADSQGSNFVKFNTKNMNEERKQKLIEALKSERLRFAEKGQHTTEHDIAIQFLLVGSTSCNPDKWELLDAVMNDFETVCSDYGC